MTSLFSLALIVSTLSSPEPTHWIAVQRFEKGQYAEAAKLCRDALQRFERTYGPDSLEAGLMLRDLASAYRGEGFLVKAEATQQKLLALVRSRLGEEDANVALALDGLGEIYFDQGRTTEARKMFQQALHIGEKTLDPRSPHLATILNDLAAAHQRDRHYREAETLFRKALAIRDSAVTRANLRALPRASN